MEDGGFEIFTYKAPRAPRAPRKEGKRGSDWVFPWRFWQLGDKIEVCSWDGDGVGVWPTISSTGKLRGDVAENENILFFRPPSVSVGHGGVLTAAGGARTRGWDPLFCVARHFFEKERKKFCRAADCKRMDDDHTLLSRFAKSKDERAFTELVRRHLDMVYGVCLRRTGSRPLAEELVQNVFATLARKAGSLKPEILVLGWLHRAAHLESLSAFRSEASRLRKMKNYMDHNPQTDPEPDRFREISPFLDQALDALPPADRDVVLLRFASDLTLQQIGSQLGKSESAAQRHLQRVLEKLAVILRRRGVTTSATALALLLGADFAKAAPTSLTVAFVSKTAIATAATTSGISIIKITTLLYIMKNKAIIIASVCLLTAGGSAVYLTARPSSSAAGSSAARIAESSATGAVTSISKEPDTAVSGDPTKNVTGQRQRPVSEYHELDKRIGASRVRLTKSATDSFLKFSDAMARIQDYQLSQQAKEETSDGIRFVFNSKADPLKSVTGLILSDEQKVQINTMRATEMAKKIEAARAIQPLLSKNRTEVMEMMLCSDAATRGEMSKVNYQAMIDGKKKEILFIDDIMPEEDTLQNPLYRTELPSILDKDQMALFEKFRSEQEAEAAKQSVNSKIVGPLGIWRTSDGPKPGAQTLEQSEENLRKAATAIAGIMKAIEAAQGN